MEILCTDLTGVFTWWTKVPKSNVDGEVADLTELEKESMSLLTC